MAAPKYSTSIRLDQSLKDKIDAIADFEMRSVANQIQVLLTQAVDRYLKNPDLLYNEETKAIYDVTPGSNLSLEEQEALAKEFLDIDEAPT